MPRRPGTGARRCATSSGPGDTRSWSWAWAADATSPHLTNDFDATAIDISEQMLEQSRRLNPGVEHLLGDMRTIRLDRKFGAVLIHDAVCHMLTESDLSKAFATAAAHLRPGGLLVTSPDYVKETFEDNKVGYACNSDGDLTMTYIEYEFDRDPNDTVYQSVIFYIMRRGSDPPLIEQDGHTLGLFPLNAWKRLLDRAGFDVEVRAFRLEGDLRQVHMFVGTLR